VRTLGRSWPLCSMGKECSQPVRSRAAVLANFKSVFPAKVSSKHHKNQMLVSRVQTWRPGNSEVPRPLRTARSRSSLSYTPLGQTQPGIMDARLLVTPGPRHPVGSEEQNNGKRIQAGNIKEILENYHVPRSEWSPPFSSSEILNF